MKTSQAFELKGMTKSLVKPYYKTQHPEHIKPALWDLLYMDSYVPVIFFYKSGPEDGGRSQFCQKVAHLKDSLSKVLVHHYPFAGRWIKTYDARIRELLCNDEGVPFFEAQVDEDMDTVIGDVDDFRPVPALGGFNLVGLNNLYFQQRVDFPMPPVFFQVTGFKCGGISLYGGFSHQATDGKGFFNFMEDWSQQAIQDKLAVPPVHDRSLTLNFGDFMGWMNGSSAAQAASVSEVQVVQTKGASDSLKASETSSKPHQTQTDEPSSAPKESGISHGETSGKDLTHVTAGAVPKADPGDDMRFPLQIKLSPKTLLVRKEAVENLKKESIAENPEDYVTRVDIITSHIWRHLSSLEPEEAFHQTRSRSRPVQEGKPVEFVISTAVDLRKRAHEPALSDKYSPNCLFVFQTPRLTPAELLSKSHLQAARIFHETVREINPTTWKDFLKKTLAILADFGNTEFRHLLTTSWMSFPMYDVEFGQGLGKPFFVGVNMEGGFLPEGYCVFLPPRPGSSAAATIQFGLQEDVLRTLTADQKFLSFFH